VSRFEAVSRVEQISTPFTSQIEFVCEVVWSVENLVNACLSTKDLSGAEKAMQRIVEVVARSESPNAPDLQTAMHQAAHNIEKLRHNDA
jgi:hypothetical protein